MNPMDIAIAGVIVANLQGNAGAWAGGQQVVNTQQIAVLGQLISNSAERDAGRPAPSEAVALDAPKSPRKRFLLRAYDTGTLPAAPVYWQSYAFDLSDAPTPPYGGPYADLTAIGEWVA